MNHTPAEKVGRAVLLALELKRHPAMPGNVVVRICEPNAEHVDVVLEKIDFPSGRALGAVAVIDANNAEAACEEIKATLDAIRKAEDEKQAIDTRLLQAKSKLGLL